jgi:2-oxoglutarate ferredoxin oxidoreductase subunit delta
VSHAATATRTGWAAADRTMPSAFVPLVIATDHCKGCGLCVAVCPPRVLELDTRVVNALGHHPIRLADASRCTSCALCARVCPDAVFTVLARAREVRP